jgi:hypothetical protein
MKFEKEDFKKMRKIDPEEARREHERKLYSRKQTLFGPDPETWDLMDHNAPATKPEKPAAFEAELKKLEDKWTL